MAYEIGVVFPDESTRNVRFDKRSFSNFMKSRPFNFLNLLGKAHAFFYKKVDLFIQILKGVAPRRLMRHPRLLSCFFQKCALYVHLNEQI